MADRFFVCYAREDQDFVHELAANLKARGVPIWLDVWDIPKGADWDKAIDEALNDCAHFLIVLSPDSVDSIEVRGELRVALDKGKPILPVLYRPCNIPRQLLTIEYVDFTLHKPADEEALAQIIHVLGMPDAAPRPAVDGADRRRSVAWPPLKSWPAWAWAVAGIVVALFLGGAFLVIRTALQLQSTPTEPPATTSTVALATATVTASVPAPTPVPQLGATRIRAVDGAQMVFVPAGEFRMGSTIEEIDAVVAACPQGWTCTSEWFQRREPTRQVELEAFWIDQFEVTNQQYRHCATDGPCTPPRFTSSKTVGRYYDNPSYDDFPVVYVTWDQAQVYAKWVGGRLPSEEEWEYAARGPTSGVYPWGSDGPNSSLLNYRNSGIGDTRPVGSYPGGTSWCGAMDMGGNVWEWTEGIGTDGSHVLRGGSFDNFLPDVRGANRGWGFPPEWLSSVGFRVCVSAQQE